MQTALEKLSPVEIDTADELVYRALRKEIVAGMPPRTRLSLRDLASRFSVSTTPVREALDRLSLEGFVEQPPRRGARVAPLLSADLHDIQTIRMGLEGVAARIGVEQASESTLTDIRRKWEKWKADWDSRSDTSVESYVKVTTYVQEQCYHATNLPELLQLISDYREKAERFLWAALKQTSAIYLDIPQAEMFLVACEQRDPNAAETGIRDLLKWTVAQLSPLIDKLSEGAATSRPTST